MVSVGGIAGAPLACGFGGIIAWNGWTAHTEERELIGDAADVTAEITNVGASEAQERVDVEDGGSYTKTVYVPQITFEYTFEGTTYTAGNVGPPADGVDHTHKYSSESRARDHFEYEEGDRVTAHVSPDQPGEGFLEKETHTVRNVGTMLFGGLFVAVGLVSFGLSLLVG